MAGALVSVAALATLVAVVALFFLLVKRVIGIAMSIVVVVFVVAVIAGVLVHMGGGDMPPLLDDLFGLVGNIIRAVLGLLSDSFSVGRSMTDN